MEYLQALSRLNRSADKLGKKTEDLFVLDFFNKIEDIKTSFDLFYTSTTLSQATDVNILHELKSSLDNDGIYEQIEVEEFVYKYFNGVDASILTVIIDTANKRFKTQLEDEDKIDFKIKAKQFVKIYSQMASIIPYEVVEWEKLFWFLKFLIPKLVIKDKNQDILDELLNSVDLSTYGLQRVKLNVSIELNEEDTVIEPQNPNPRANYSDEDEKDPLEEIINSFNEKWFQSWDVTPQEQRVRFVKIAQKIKEHRDFQSKFIDNLDTHTRNLAYVKIFNEVMNKQRREELKLYKIVSQDDGFKSAMQESVKIMVTM